MPLIAGTPGRIVVLTVTVTDSAGHATEDEQALTVTAPDARKRAK